MFQQTFHLYSTLGGKHGFCGLGIVVILIIHQTLAIANEPNLTTQPAENDGRTRQTILRMFRQSWQHGLFVMLVDIGGDATQKHLTCGVGRHRFDIAAYQLHGIAPIAAKHAMTIVGLRGAAVDNGNEIISYDDSVLAFLRGIFGDEGLLDNFHWCNFWDTAR